jgi:hypothetical protein
MGRLAWEEDKNPMKKKIVLSIHTHLSSMVGMFVGAAGSLWPYN